MKPPGDCRQGQKVVWVKEEMPEHSTPPPGEARSLSVHIKEVQEETSWVYDMKEEAPCVDEGELQSSGLHGVSAAAMLAALYTDHVVKGELLLGPELPHRPSVTPVFCEPAAYKPRVALALCAWDHTYAATGSAAGGVHIKEEQEFRMDDVVHVKEEPSVSCLGTEGDGCSGVSEAAMRAGLYADHIIKDELVLGPERTHRPTLLSSPPEPAAYKPRVALALCAWDHTYAATGSAAGGVHIKEEQEFRMDDVVHVKEEEPSVSCLGTEGDGCSGVSEAAMRAGLYADHIVKDELVLGPERPHRPTLLSSPPGHVVSSDAGVAEALGRRCSVRLERLLLDAERRACRVGRRTYRLRPESEPRRAATPAVDTYRCDHCDKAFRHKSVLSKHIHTHLSTRLARSRYSTREDSNLEQHQKFDTGTKGNLQRHTEVKRFKCNYCNYKCRRKGDLKRHEMTHTGVKPFLCKYCGYKCRHKGQLTIHEMTHTGVKPFQCYCCDYKCRQKVNLRRHEMTHTGVKPFQCNYCDYKCIHKERLRNHEMTHTGLKPFQCNYCDYKCSRKGTLRTHEMTHTGLKPFQCDYCDYKCRQKGHLTKHEMTHTRVKLFQCNYCDYKSSCKERLRYHEMTHTGLKPFECDYCDLKCSRKTNLRKHEMIHTGVKPFQCKYCDYKCRKIGNLRTHEMTHTRLKPFQCKYCDYKFRQKRYLTNHEMTHTGVKPFQCNYCDYKCIHKESLRNHEMRLHTKIV